MPRGFQELDPMILEEIRKEEAKKKAEKIVGNVAEAAGAVGDKVEEGVQGVNNFLKERASEVLPGPLDEELRATIKKPKEESESK